MFSKRIYIFLIFLIFFIFPQKVNAAFSYTIDSISTSSISDKDQIVSVTLTISDLPSGDSYFRVGINEGSSYAGYNKVGTDWVKLASLSEDETNVTCSKYLKVSSDGTYVIDFKIGNDIDITNGEHILKAHRFRSTCTVDALKPETSITVLLPTPSPSPTPTPTNPPTNSPTQAPTASPTVKPTPTKSPSPKPTPKPTPTESGQAEESLVLEPQVLSLSTNASSPEPEIIEKKKSPTFAIILITLGMGFLGYGGYLLYNMKNAIQKGEV